MGKGVWVSKLQKVSETCLTNSFWQHKTNLWWVLGKFQHLTGWSLSPLCSRKSPRWMVRCPEPPALPVYLSSLNRKICKLKRLLRELPRQDSRPTHLAPSANNETPNERKRLLCRAEDTARVQMGSSSTKNYSTERRIDPAGVGPDRERKKCLEQSISWSSKYHSQTDAAL